MKKLIFVALGFFMISAFANAFDEKELRNAFNEKEFSNNVKATLHQIQQEQVDPNTQLFIAIYRCESIYPALKKGADVNYWISADDLNFRNLGFKDDVTPLTWAIKNRDRCEHMDKTVRDLLKEGALPRRGSDDQPTALAFLLNESLKKSDPDDFGIVEALLEYKDSINFFGVYPLGIEDSFSRWAEVSPLVVAMLLEDDRILDLLLEKGNKKWLETYDNYSGNTIIMYAVKANKIDAVKKFYKAGVDLNAVNDDNKTALDLAYELRNRLEAKKNPYTNPRSTKELDTANQIISFLKANGGVRSNMIL